ncbi:MAG: hypothetical protein PHW69_09560, partial [Elusimicrobiaceae bacterium]|nr:hypothetical protein [Elusimicrobiaceae bacterium]
SYYRIYADTTPAATWDNGYLLATATDTSYAIAYLADDVVTFFRVTAVDTGPNELESEPSQDISVYVNDTFAPAVSALASPSHGLAGAWSTVSRASFTWTGSDTGLSGLKGFYIGFDHTASVTASALKLSGVFTTAYSTSAVFADDTWYFHIAAIDNAGNLSTAQNALFRIDTAAPVSTLAMAETEALGSGSFALTLTIADTSGENAAPALQYYVAEGATKTVTLTGSGGAYAGNVFIESYDSTGTGHFVYSVSDRAGNSSAVLLGTTAFTVDTAISSDTGGTVVNSDDTAVYVPAGSIISTVTITVETPSPALADIVAANNKLKVAGGVDPITTANCARKFTATTSTNTTLTVFAAPVKISIPYPDSNSDGYLDGTLIKPADLKIYYLDTGAGWTEVPGSAPDTANRLVTAWVDHFSIYSLLSTAKLSVDLSAILVYPQPCYFKNTPKVTIAMLPDTADLAVRIYTMDGTLLRTMTSNDGITMQGSNRKAEWDGRNSSGEKVASGMYLYLIKADGETKTGRPGVFW